MTSGKRLPKKACFVRLHTVHGSSSKLSEETLRLSVNCVDLCIEKSGRSALRTVVLIV
ncbi:Exopolyphosphatase/pppGpp-phosphohydrolase [Pseudomonas syringae pv. actinidiae]|uniref:Exopolyphosphatase/pppGpp-phosphohydrolase n=1 Tax=Pseudomonas syringae pv. actinidiae TaxID=103796 RepID=A0AAN4QDJ9_PSESF|nr:Exopolyphosphatase/pppGpp-phosphohydrolase [Pseudomonas syringae pv. actinidiae]